MVESDTKTESKMKRRILVILEWTFLAFVVITYQAYLQSTLDFPSDNEELLFGQYRMMEKSNNPNAFLTIAIRSTGGRLGNSMFQYASSMAIAQDFSKKLPNPSKLCMHPEFDLPNLKETFVGPFVDDCSREDVKTMWEIDDLAYAKHHDITLPPCSGDRCTFALKGYYQSWKYFDEYQKNVRDMFQFKPPILEKAREVMAAAQGQSQAVITIGLHVRKGDMDHNGHFYLRDPPVKYYESAMNHFRDQYGSIRFLVVSDNPDWCKAQSIFKDAQIISNTPAVDMAVLSMCHHVIVSRGSFGWWSAYLTGAEAIYYKDMFVMAHPENFGKVKRDDHFPSNWIGMK
mmetsp:Transcript_2008/g.2955  ORF Transcript_2008/g.2955 Transcript_2008/m.2955 type:complete len:344 (-) Transcript_2008:161-1192(-)|eukprot:CAMPEP_0194213718 /NCGR_PEP_ID=MMETSP0156-20130528/14508_1 /TAXON_ID=33649 /ORGANISM="Thalassionema nitzschioides, Strain L26-B" /LENGTH=343 /DNA_ID=CAMNT_0038941815 /DNA_START=87 /DNA_END=1118 /DNA_ORIENTATION=+